MSNKFIPIEEAAECLGVTRQTVCWYCNKGYLTHKKSNRRVVIEKSSLEAFKENYFSVVQANENLAAQVEQERKDIERKIKDARASLVGLRCSQWVFNAGKNVIADILLTITESLNESYISDKEKEVMFRMIGDYTVTEIADIMGLTRARVQQLAWRCVRKMERSADDIRELITEKNRLSASRLSQHCHIKKIQEEIQRLENENAKLKADLGIRNDRIAKGLSPISERRKYAESLNIRSIDEMTVRTFNCLKSLDVETLYDLVKLDKSTLLKCRNFGRKSMCELEELLESNPGGFSFHLGMTDDELNKVE